MTDKHICELCWHPYVPANARQRFCSAECREDARKQVGAR